MWVEDKEEGEGVLYAPGVDRVLYLVDEYEEFSHWKKGIGYQGAVNSCQVPHGQGVGVWGDGRRYEGGWVKGRGKGKERRHRRSIASFFLTRRERCWRVDGHAEEDRVI